ncbi:beta-galactosidase [Thalassotalea sp. HSM 43]|uniref:beta-galactosidase n=1 Tax=Thalassotalea sp. HSM 43 TaxID=2552945 RepID=UPI00167968B5|nr:beta-galactosidase [Thalassotalea sp. HSM 43]
MTLAISLTATVNAKSLQRKVLFNFSEQPSDRSFAQLGIKHSNARLVWQNQGLTLHIRQGDTGQISFNGQWDTHQFAYLVLELSNNSEQRIRFDSEVDGQLNRYKGKPIKAIGWLEPLETRKFNNLLLPHYMTRSTVYKEMNEDFPNTRGMPDSVSFTRSFDLTKTNRVAITVTAQQTDANITIKKIYLLRPSVSPLYQTDKAAFFPFIDNYGQYKHADWLGKTKSDQQLKQDVAEERANLDKYPGSPEWSQYGGYRQGPKLDATGHFRVAKYKGKWWFVDPDGYLFWSSGINSALKLSVGTPIVGREHFFEFMPKANNQTYQQFFLKNGEFDFGKINLSRKYGTDYQSQYFQLGLERMRSWGTNTVAGFSNLNGQVMAKDNAIPYTHTIGTNWGVPGITSKFPDVFNPRFASAVDTRVKQAASGIKNDPYFIGFFVDNELYWKSPNTLAKHLATKNGSSAAKRQYVEILKTQYQTIDKLNTLLNSKLNNWQQVLKANKNLPLDTLEHANIVFYEKMTHKYFSTIRTAIDNYAPNKLYLGCRWHVNEDHRNTYNVAIGAQYLDVVSFNQYDNELTADTFTTLQGIDKPYIVSEFNFGAIDSGKFYPGLGHASEQRNRGEKYQNFLHSALNDARNIGVHWFMWGDSTTAGRSVVGENANAGFVSQTDRPYYQLLDYVRKANYALYQYRLNSKAK